MEDRDLNSVIDDIFSIIPVFTKKMRAAGSELMAYEKLSKGHMGILIVLKTGKSLPMSAIGKMLSISKPNITTLVDRLVEIGMAERVPDETDRRVIHIRLTQKGDDFILQYKENFRRHIKEGLWKFKDEDLTLLRETMRNMKTLLNKLE